MKKPLNVLAAAGCAAVALAACTSDTGSTQVEQKVLGDSDVLVTTADVRMTISKPVTFDAEKGRVKPRRVVCTEPSPDIAKAVQESFGMGASLGVEVPQGVSAAAALSISKARAEAAAQLGERLATIQLLRDGLFRACEAYANGTFSEVTYAVLLSRYDDAMVSLLIGELAAGNFGRSLAAVGGDAESKAAADANVKTALELAKSADDKATRKSEELEKAERDVAQKEQAVSEAEPGSAEESQRKRALETAKARREDKKREAELAAKTAAETAATAAATAAGAISHKPSDRAVEVMHEMQRKYLENINSDALVVACVTEMASKKRNQRTVLTDFCTGASGNGGALHQILAHHAAMLESVKTRALLQRDQKAFSETVLQLKQMKAELDGLNGKTE